MRNLIKMVKSIEFCNEEFEFYCIPEFSRSPIGKLVAQLSVIQLKINQGLLRLCPVDENEAAVIDAETGEVLCILRK